MTQAAKNLGAFLLKHGQQWQSYAPNKPTVDIVCAFVNLGLLDVNTHDQMRVRSHAKLRQYMDAA